MPGLAGQADISPSKRAIVVQVKYTNQRIDCMIDTAEINDLRGKVCFVQ